MDRAPGLWRGVVQVQWQLQVVSVSFFACLCLDFLTCKIGAILPYLTYFTELKAGWVSE